MIPILFESTETAFTSNGIGRLRDCISCIVTEERNGIYECDFEYPMDGANYDLIQIGRIIGVTHDETKTIQPFDIVSFSKPIDGVVTFHCTHISYRMSYMTTRSDTARNSLSAAFNHLAQYSQPSCPFNFWTDKTSTGYCGALQSVPYTVRQILGGVEGSILDTYGGEYEWDTWTVKLWNARGQYRDFSIRYGVNMLEYNEDYDSSGCYSSCRPFWTDGTTTVVGDKQTNSGLPPSGREQCVPLDVSEKFESQPTKAQVEAMAVSVMNSQNPTIPSQNIKVSFVRLQDMGEFADYQNLLQCQLCDTIKVIFPDFNSSGQFKIVKTVWNVLTGKYDEMELGDLSISLSEAMGISDIQRDSKSTIEQIQTQIETLKKDYITFQGTSGNWYYRKWNSGRFEAWYRGTATQAITSSAGNVYMASSSSTLTLPSAIKVASVNDVDTIYITANTSSYTVWTALFSPSVSSNVFSCTYRLCSGGSRTSTDYPIRAYVAGTYTS